MTWRSNKISIPRSREHKLSAPKRPTFLYHGTTQHLWETGSGNRLYVSDDPDEAQSYAEDASIGDSEATGKIQVPVVFKIKASQLSALDWQPDDGGKWSQLSNEEFANLTWADTLKGSSSMVVEGDIDSTKSKWEMLSSKETCRSCGHPLESNPKCDECKYERSRSHTPYSAPTSDNPRIFPQVASRPNLRKTNVLERKMTPVVPSSAYESLFIGPSGNFYGIAGFHHHALSNTVKLSPSELEALGFVRVYAPANQRVVSMSLTTLPTASQLEAMKSLGVTFSGYSTVIWAHLPGEYRDDRIGDHDTYWSFNDLQLSL